MNKSGFQWISWNVRRIHPVVVANKCLVRDSLLKNAIILVIVTGKGWTYKRYDCFFQEFSHDLWDTSRSSDLILATALVGAVRGTQTETRRKDVSKWTPKWPPKSPPILQQMVTLRIFGTFSLVSSVFPFGNMEILSWRRTPCVWQKSRLELYLAPTCPNTLRWLFRWNLKKNQVIFWGVTKVMLAFLVNGLKRFPKNQRFANEMSLGWEWSLIFFSSRNLVWRWCYTTRQLPICYIRYLVQMYDMPAKLIPNKNYIVQHREKLGFWWKFHENPKNKQTYYVNIYSSHLFIERCSIRWLNPFFWGGVPFFGEGCCNSW